MSTLETGHIELSRFASKTDLREWMHEPFAYKGKLAASDGMAIFFSNIATDKKTPELVPVAKFDEFFALFEGLDFWPMPALQFPEMPNCEDCCGTGKSLFGECPECCGDGEVTAETDYNSYEVECRTCAGDGKIKDKISVEPCFACDATGKTWTGNSTMKIEGVPFGLNPELMLRISDAEDLELAVLESKAVSQAIAFRCSEGCGIIMGMRKTA